MKNIKKWFICLMICSVFVVSFAKAEDFDVYEGSDFSFTIKSYDNATFSDDNVELKSDYQWINYQVIDNETIEIKGTAPILGTEFSENSRDFEFRLIVYNETNESSTLFDKTYAITVNRILLISDVEVKVTFLNGDSKTRTLSDFGTIRDVKPYSTLEFKIKVENQGDYDLEDVYAELIIYDIDDGDDLELESDEKDIRRGRTSTLTMNVKIPLLVEEDYYDVELIVYGEDEYGREFSIKKTYDLRVEKDRYEIYISNLEIFPDRIFCSGYSEIIGTIYNIGNREIDLQITATNTDLGISYSETVTLSEDPFDDENKFRISIPIRIENAKETKENIIAFYFKGLDSAGSIYQIRDVALDVEKCQQQEQEENDDEDIIIITPPKDTDTDNNQTSESSETTNDNDSGKKEIIIYEQPFVESPAFIAMLAMILGLLVILLIVVLFLVKKK